MPITINEDMAYVLIEHYADLHYKHLRLHGCTDPKIQDQLESLCIQVHDRKHAEGIIESKRVHYFEDVKLVEVYIDGSVKHNNQNPELRQSAVATAIYVDDTLQRVRAKPTGNCTSTEAEYLALKMALDNLIQMGMQEHPVVIYSDAKGVINQVNMVHRTKAKHIVAMRDSIRNMMAHFTSIKLVHIESSENFLCDTLSKDIIDTVSEDHEGDPIFDFDRREIP